MTAADAAKPPGSPVRVAVVGLGWAGRSIWLPRLNEHPRFSVTAAVDALPAARERADRVSGGVRILSSTDELSAFDIDLAVVAVPNHLHSSVAGQLLVAGISVFLEKPVCLSSAESAQLADAERSGGGVLLAGSAARYRADLLALGVLVESLGRVRHVELSWVRARGVPDAGGWFTQRRLSGGGALLDLGWHLLDSVGPLLGPVAFDQVIGTISDDFVNVDSSGARWRQRPGAGAGSDPAGDVEDTARGFLITEDGVSVALRASWASHEAHDVTVIRVEGSAGTATLRCTFGFSPNRVPRSTLTRTSDGRTVDVPLPEEPIGTEYHRQLDELPGLLVDPASKGRAIEDADRTVRVIERFYDSARRAARRCQPVPAGSVEA